MLCTSITSAVSPVLAVAMDPPKAQIGTVILVLLSCM
jgi:hypothetical protein